MSQNEDQSEALRRVNVAQLAQDERAELEHAREVVEEYRNTLAFVAVLTERLAQATGERVILINDTELADSPDLIAHRDEARGRVTLTTGR